MPLNHSFAVLFISFTLGWLLYSYSPLICVDLTGSRYSILQNKLLGGRRKIVNYGILGQFLGVQTLPLDSPACWLSNDIWITNFDSTSFPGYQLRNRSSRYPQLSSKVILKKMIIKLLINHSCSHRNLSTSEYLVGRIHMIDEIMNAAVFHDIVLRQATPSIHELFPGPFQNDLSSADYLFQQETTLNTMAESVCTVSTEQ